MNAKELIDRMRCNLLDPTDEDGLEIEEFAGCKFRPLTVADYIAVGQHCETHGANSSYQMVIALGIVNPDGTRIFSDDECKELGTCINGPIERAFTKLRIISGSALKDVKPGAEKKTTSTGATS